MIRGVWTPSTIGWLLFAATVPVAVQLGFEQGLAGLLRLALTGATLLGWQLLFRATLGVPITAAASVSALALALLAPAEATLAQLCLAASFGIVLGELVFGGWGRNFLSAGVLALAFLSLSLPNAAFSPSSTTMVLAVLPGALLLLLTGVLALPVLITFTLGLISASLMLGTDASVIAACGSIAFVAVFLVADPVASAATDLGRWLYGLLAGVLSALLATGAAAPKATVFAALLAALFAPLIDRLVIAWRPRPGQAGPSARPPAELRPGQDKKGIDHG